MFSEKDTLVFGIEGPAGSGKSTMANTVGHKMGIPVIEGGIFYRQLTYAALQEKISLDDTTKLVELAASIPSRFSLDSGSKAILYDGHDVSDELRSELVSINVGKISRQIEVREVVESQIKQLVLAHKTVIIVGRSVKKLLPDAYVLNVSIDPDEADRRHKGRVAEPAQSVRERNAIDHRTAEILGTTEAHEATIDVTDLSPEGQAAALHDFIESHSS